MSRDARQEEGRAQGQEAPRGQDAQARHRRRRQDRLTRRLASWWERDPAALDAEIKELTEAGFRVHREIHVGGQLALNISRESETYLVLYHHRTTREGEALLAVSPWPDPKVSVAAHNESALWAVEELRRGAALSLFDHGAGCVYVPAALARGITGAGGVLKLGHSRVNCGSYALRALTGTTKSLDDADPSFLRAFPDEVTGLWARGQAWAQGPVEDVVARVEGMIGQAHGLSIDEVRGGRHRVLGLVRSLDAAGWHSWQFVRRDDAGRPVVLRTEEWLPEDLDRRAPFLSRLRGKTVTLVGCGAVGWTVALELARSGVSKFVLYDDDKIGAGNLPRLPVFMGAVGRYKVDVLAEQLESIAPGIDIDARPWDVGVNVGLSGLIRDDSDLTINVTGEEVSTDETNAASIILGRPALYGWVTNGVLAGRMFRVRPDQSACYDCVREAEPEPLASSGLARLRGEGAWIGACFNVDAFACALARMAVLTLAGDAVSEHNPDHVVLSFDGVVPVARTLTFERDPQCRWCG